jgi:hypothetical protein
MRNPRQPPLPDALPNRARPAPGTGTQPAAGHKKPFARRILEAYPEIEPNVRATVRGIVGSSFTDEELRVLEDRALDRFTLYDGFTLQGIRAGSPVILTPRQKERLDEIVDQLGDDDLGVRARVSYADGVRRGEIRIR